MDAPITNLQNITVNILINPLKNMQYHTTTTCWLCWTAVFGGKKFTCRTCKMFCALL